MVTHPNMVKKLIGMYVVQTSILLLLVTIGVKQGATVPILQLLWLWDCSEKAF